MNSRPRSVLVIAYNTADELRQCLDTLRDECVLVVDNSSSAEVRAVCAEAGVTYFDSGANLGFAGGVNFGLRELARRDVVADVALVNPDARITSAQLDVLSSALHDPANSDVALVAPRLRHPDGYEQRVAWPFPSPSNMWREAIRLAQKTPNGGFLIGAVLLVRAEALAQIGEFDDHYFLYAEEVDWQRRAHEAGWRGLLVSDVVAEHVGAATSSEPARREALFHAGHETYIRRWFGPLGWLSYRTAAISAAGIRAVLATGAARESARRRMALYLRGPRRAAQVTNRATRLRITHVLTAHAPDGTAQHVTELARLQAAAGHDVRVVGSAESFMPDALGNGVTWTDAGGLGAALRAVAHGGSRDVVHAHLTTARLVAVAARPFHGGVVVTSRDADGGVRADQMEDLYRQHLR